jgi:hypothetical protein
MYNNKRITFEVEGGAEALRLVLGFRQEEDRGVVAGVVNLCIIIGVLLV